MGTRVTPWHAASVIIGVGMCVLSAGYVRADEPSNAGLKAEVELLKERLAKLEDQLDSQKASEAGAASGSAIVQLPSGLHGVNLSGFVDTTYTYNFNTPKSPRTNTLRVFDTRANSVMLNNAELVLEKPVSVESPVGFRTDLDFGTDSEVVGGVTTGLGTGDDEVDLQQAYVEYLAPVGNGLDVKAGKFVTLHGAEVIESKDNWNISRSLLFGFAIPFTHTGVRANYAWCDKFSTVVGVNNGWDVVDDNNEAKTVELGFTAIPLEKVSVGSTYMLGAEQTGNNTNQRSLWDIVASYQPIEPLQLKLNYDYGWEDNAAGFHNNAVWQGLAGYARYALNDQWALALRGEWFSDPDGVRTALGRTGLKVYEWTATSEYQLNKHLLSRLEYRHDQANENVFLHDKSGQRPNQDTIALEFIAPF